MPARRQRKPRTERVTRRLIDLSHAVEHGLVTYKGLPAPVITDHMTREESRKYYAAKTEFHIGKIEMVANTGTYLDSPFHRFADGKDLAQLPLRWLANLEGICVTAKPGRAIGVQQFERLRVKGKAVLVRTDWSRHWKTPQYFEGHPFLTAGAAKLLARGGAALVGIDSYNIDDTADLTRPVHTVLLGNEIPIVEHMTGLEKLPREGFRFFAVPVKVKSFGTFPVRAFAMV
ncbi:MAG TPA: cyclase family protein [Terriglobales bacterium]|nr:cyclase family protein [Terriglobales bacterium]